MWSRVLRYIICSTRKECSNNVCSIIQLQNKHNTLLHYQLLVAAQDILILIIHCSIYNSSALIIRINLRIRWWAIVYNWHIRIIHCNTLRHSRYCWFKKHCSFLPEVLFTEKHSLFQPFQQAWANKTDSLRSSEPLRRERFSNGHQVVGKGSGYLHCLCNSNTCLIRLHIVR